MELVALMFQRSQERRFVLEVDRIANNLTDDDLAPGGTGETVGGLRDALLEGEKRLRREFSSLMPEVDALLESHTKQ